MNGITILTLDLTENREGKLNAICQKSNGEIFLAHNTDEILENQAEFICTTDGRNISELFEGLKKRNYLREGFVKLKSLLSF